MFGIDEDRICFDCLVLRFGVGSLMFIIPPFHQCSIDMLYFADVDHSWSLWLHHTLQCFARWYRTISHNTIDYRVAALADFRLVGCIFSLVVTLCRRSWSWLSSLADPPGMSLELLESSLGGADMQKYFLQISVVWHCRNPDAMIDSIGNGHSHRFRDWICWR